MKKLAHYLRQAKSRGLNAMLLISLFVGGLLYAIYTFTVEPQVNQTLAHPEIQAFLQEFPDLTIKDGKIQGDIVWARLIPGLNVPVVVNTAVDQIDDKDLPGIFVTQSMVVDNVNGAQWSITGLEDTVFNLKKFIDFTFQVVLPIAVFVVPFVACWLLFLATVLLSYIIAWIARIPHGNSRLWRTSMLAVIVMLLLLAIPVGASWLGPVLTTTIFSVLILGTINNKEI